MVRGRRVSFCGDAGIGVALGLALCWFGVSDARAQQAAAPGQNPPAATPAVVDRVAVAPEQVTLVPGDSKEFTATVTGTGAFSTDVTWSVNGVKGGNAGLGTISSAGLYITPYPVPTSVTITATSKGDPTKFATATISFAAAPLADGPALRVDRGAATHAISPLIYGMNAWRLKDPDNESAKVARAVRLTVDRWGGDGVTRYNYKLDISNHADDWYFENIPERNTKYPDESEFNTQVMADRAVGAKTLGTVPVIGWVAKSRKLAGSYSVAKYGPQQKTDPYWHEFGNGIRADGSRITNNDPNDTSMPIDETWDAEWVQYLVKRFGDAAHGGVAIYSLDNEPNWWDKVHRDVHPAPFTYDELTENGIKVAKAVKAADPTAEVSGPVIDYWLTYFYSKQDLKSIQEHGWNVATGATDRKAHGNVPFIEYYLRAFKAAQDEDPKHARLLDYLDIHTYFAAGDAMLKPAGTSRQQRAVLESTRVFWDAKYTDYPFRNPDNLMLTAAPEMIPRMKRWIAANYPGTKTAITEYNFGGQEHISGAVAQADILGIFGREGLDLGALWQPPELDSPSMFAFKIYRNYDDAGGAFGDESVAATSADQGKLAVYAARRNADRALTVVVINKTFGDLKADLPMAHFKASAPAKVFQYSGADLKEIRALPQVKAEWERKSKTSVVKEQVFPAMSITMYVIAGK